MLARRVYKVLVTYDLREGTQSDRSATEIIANIKSTTGRNREILGTRKLPSNTIILIFKSTKTKNVG